MPNVGLAHGFAAIGKFGAPYLLQLEGRFVYRSYAGRHCGCSYVLFLWHYNSVAGISPVANTGNIKINDNKDFAYLSIVMFLLKKERKQI
mgnify:CR=1 FL=1